MRVPRGNASFNSSIHFVLSSLKREAGDVTVRPRVVGYETMCIGVVHTRHDNWNRVGCVPGGLRRLRPIRENDCHLPAHQSAREVCEAINSLLQRDNIEGDILPLDISELAQSLPNLLHASIWKCQEADSRNVMCWLLCAGHKRSTRRANQRDELAPLHTP